MDNQTNPPLTNAPIVEAILDIECDTTPGLAFDTLEMPARDAFRDQYPKFTKQITHELEIDSQPAGKADPDAPQEVQAKSSHAVQAFRFVSHDEKQLVQVRRTGYSFNRLAPYTSLDDYFSEIKRSWEIYCRIANPVMVRKIQLRFINRIELPINKKGQVKLEKYLRMKFTVMDLAKLHVTGFVHQQNGADPVTGNQVALVVAGQPSNGTSLPIIVDNVVFSHDFAMPNDWGKIYEKILSLRDLKNRIFNSTLTKLCLSQYQ